MQVLKRVAISLTFGCSEREHAKPAPVQASLPPAVQQVLEDAQSVSFDEKKRESSPPRKKLSERISLVCLSRGQLAGAAGVLASSPAEARPVSVEDPLVCLRDYRLDVADGVPSCSQYSSISVPVAKVTASHRPLTSGVHAVSISRVRAVLLIVMPDATDWPGRKLPARSILQFPSLLVPCACTCIALECHACVLATAYSRRRRVSDMRCSNSTHSQHVRLHGLGDLSDRCVQDDGTLRRVASQSVRPHCTALWIFLFAN